MQTLISLVSSTRVRPTHLTSAVRRWAASSQQVARRNAKLASTECADRRAVRLDVDAYLRDHLSRRAEVGVAVHG